MRVRMERSECRARQGAAIKEMSGANGERRQGESYKEVQTQ